MSFEPARAERLPLRLLWASSSLRWGEMGVNVIRGVGLMHVVQGTYDCTGGRLQRSGI
jgi:hypothetical protein